MVNELPFGTSEPGKLDQLFEISVCPGNFPVGRTKKTFTMYLHPKGNFREFVVNGKQALFPRMSRCDDLIELVCISAEDMKLILRIFEIITVAQN